LRRGSREFEDEVKVAVADEFANFIHAERGHRHGQEHGHDTGTAARSFGYLDGVAMFGYGEKAAAT
jgi:hypothetical protein